MGKTTKNKNEITILKKEFKLVEASKLRVNDDFMLLEPKTKKGKLLKTQIQKAIESGLNDFLKPVYDPSFVNFDPDYKKDDNLTFEPKKEPILRRTFEWWEEVAKSVGGHIATRTEYNAFLGVLIKALFEKKNSEIVWDLVANNKEWLGTFIPGGTSNSFKKVYQTGTTKVCGFDDLANTYKLLKEDDPTGGFLIASGVFTGKKTNYSLSDMGKCYDADYKWYDAVGLILF